MHDAGDSGQPCATPGDSSGLQEYWIRDILCGFFVCLFVLTGKIREDSALSYHCSHGQRSIEKTQGAHLKDLL